MHPVLLVSDDAMLGHDPGPGHPERPQRLAALLDRMKRRLAAPVQWLSPDPAAREALVRVHDAEYLGGLEELRGRRARLDADTVISPGSVRAAWLAAGAAVAAVESVTRGPVRRAFALVRPPGHHAERAGAMGFCLLNNVAVAAAHARAALGIRRVLVIDWDVHHGNGTQHAFESDPSVLYFSTHRFPFYPGTGDLDETGSGPGRGFTVNVPLPGGCGDADLETAFDRILLPIADAFAPGLVLVSAGFDAHALDPLGGMRMTEGGFARLCRRACAIADRHAGGRLVLVLEGGYDLEALAGSAAACVEEMGRGGSEPPAVSLQPERTLRAAAVIERVVKVQKEFWPLG